MSDKAFEFGLVTGNKSAFLKGVSPDENICYRTFPGTSGAFAHDVLMPCLVGEKNGLLTTVEIAMNPHCIQERILCSGVAIELR